MLLSSWWRGNIAGMQIPGWCSVSFIVNLCMIICLWSGASLMFLIDHSVLYHCSQVNRSIPPSAELVPSVEMKSFGSNNYMKTSVMFWTRSAQVTDKPSLPWGATHNSALHTDFHIFRSCRSRGMGVGGTLICSDKQVHLHFHWIVSLTLWKDEEMAIKWVAVFMIIGSLPLWAGGRVQQPCGKHQDRLHSL